MSVLFGSMFIIIFILLALLAISSIWLWRLSHHRPVPVMTKPMRYGLLAYLIVVVFVGIAFAKTVHPVAAPTRISTGTVQSGTAATNAQAAGTLLQKMPAHERAKYNRALVTSLTENHGFAAAGDQGYDYAAYLETLVYEHQQLVINVNSDFNNLSNARKTTVATSAQNMAATQLTMLGKNLAPGSYRLKTTICYAGKTIGQAPATHSNHFTWLKNGH